jgi:hypothetical protein
MSQQSTPRESLSPPPLSTLASLAPPQILKPILLLEKISATK